MMTDEARARAFDWAIASSYLSAPKAQECMDVGKRQANRPHVSLVDIRKQIRAALAETTDPERRDYLSTALDSIDGARGMYRKEPA